MESTNANEEFEFKEEKKNNTENITSFLQMKLENINQDYETLKKENTNIESNIDQKDLQIADLQTMIQSKQTHFEEQFKEVKDNHNHESDQKNESIKQLREEILTMKATNDKHLDEIEIFRVKEKELIEIRNKLDINNIDTDTLVRDLRNQIIDLEEKLNQRNKK